MTDAANPSPDATLALPQVARPWQRGSNTLALALVVLAHVLVLIASLVWRNQVHSRPQAASSDVALHPPEHKPPPPPPPRVELEPPKLPLPNLPQPLEPPPVEIIKVEAPPAPSPAPVAVAPPTAAPAPTVGTGTGADAAGAAKAASPARLFEECADTPDRAMVAEVYNLRVGASSLADMRNRKPVKTVCLSQLNISPRDFREGFPGMDRIEWFGLDIRFTVDMPQDMTRDILLLSDDGSSLSIDGVEVLNNDGIHAPAAVKASVKLTKGPHAFRVRYFQGPGTGIALMLTWKRPEDTEWGYIARRILSRPDAPAKPAETGQP
ncbi:PA14 domain-containing protein [Roseateles sp.]|uniref:PA14 domain-containing protein n=1 Tax=Roseateles sp. TaxID=1971397 RepID=UPI0039438CCB